MTYPLLIHKNSQFEIIEAFEGCFVKRWQSGKVEVAKQKSYVSKHHFQHVQWLESDAIALTDLKTFLEHGEKLDKSDPLGSIMLVEQTEKAGIILYWYGRYYYRILSQLKKTECSIVGEDGTLNWYVMESREGHSKKAVSEDVKKLIRTIEKEGLMVFDSSVDFNEIKCNPLDPPAEQAAGV